MKCTPPVSDLHALIRACKAEPEDDAPRLILADWLDEHDEEERATFIRRQIAEPSLTAEQLPWDPEWLGAWEDWRKECDRQNPGWKNPTRFVRGFLQISDYYRELYDDIDRILQSPFDWSWVESFRFGSWHDGDWTPLFESPLLLELSSLSFSDDHYRSKLAEPLSKCPYLCSLKSLRFLMLSNADDGFRRISENAGMRNLQAFELVSTDIARRGAHAFARSETWDELKSCCFRSNRFTDEALNEFTRGRIKPKLEMLDISFGRYSDTGLVKLSRSELFPSLRELHIGYHICPDRENVSFGTFGIESLLNSPQLHFDRLILTIISEEPPPKEILRLVEQASHRVTFEFRDLREDRI